MDPNTGEYTEPESAQVLETDRPNWKRHVFLFISGQTISTFGSMLVGYAVMWYLVIETQSGLMMALWGIFGALPQALVSTFAGVLADRVNRKLLIIVADASIAIATVILALFMTFGYTEYWLIFLILAIRSAGQGIQNPAVTAMIPQIVPTSQLMRVNGIRQSFDSALMLLAPAAAGAIYGLWGIIPTFYVDAATAFIGIAFLLMIPVKTLRGAEEQGSYISELVEGVKYVWHHAFVRWILTLFAIVFFLTVAPSALTPLMLEREWGGEVWKLTVLEIAFAVGMMIGGIVIGIVGSKIKKIPVILGAILSFSIFSLLLGVAPDLITFYVFMFLVGISVPFFSTTTVTLLQETVEPEKQGRVFGLMGIVFALAMPVGLAILGPLADIVDIRWILIVTGVFTVLICGWAVAVPSGRKAITAINEHELNKAESAKKQD
ncbi:MAG: MFS transporter [Microbacteriaceae bacterium]|nr:MFS transporter [Microbacteriaceae bacterium]